MLTPQETNIARIGPCETDSPLFVGGGTRHGVPEEVRDSERVLLDDEVDHLLQSGSSIADLPSFELAGPRRKLYFDPGNLRCGIVTCGGLCPGLNDVIRGLVMELYHRYGVRSVFGLRYGYQGFIKKYGHEVLDLNPEVVKDIHADGGTILGTSRGHQDIGEIVDCLQGRGVGALFTIGGDGTQRGAHEIAKEITRRDAPIAVIGVPKTIDNDIPYVEKSFGFDTACTTAMTVVRCAHTEAQSARNGIGIVKLMGRNSGAIACHTALASGDPNVVLIPEVPFDLEGEDGLLQYLRRRLKRREHACIVVAEGAGQHLMGAKELGADASGNVLLRDVGLFLKERIHQYLSECDLEHSIKYIDPSYIIRSVPANAQDSLYCLRLGQAAAHAAMTGRTAMVVSLWHGKLVHVPMGMVTVGRKRVDPAGDVWQSVLEMTGQPARFRI